MDRKKTIDDLTRKLEEWDSRLEAAEQRVDAEKEVWKGRLDRSRAEAKSRRAQLRSRLEAAKQSADEGWEKTSGELQDAWKQFREAAGEVVDAVKK